MGRGVEVGPTHNITGQLLVRDNGDMKALELLIQRAEIKGGKLSVMNPVLSKKESFKNETDVKIVTDEQVLRISVVSKHDLWEILNKTFRLKRNDTSG